MKPKILIAILLYSLSATVVVASSATLPPTDETAAFKAAGFALKSKEWRSSCGRAADTADGAYEAGQISEVRDLNGDGRPEAVITEGGTGCYGMTGSGFSVVSKQSDGSWKLITSDTGIANFLATKGEAGWPDIEIGGPGFCFPVQRWNGHAYVPHGNQYEGKPCKPS